MEMIACQLNRLSEVPLYEQLYIHIKQEVINGRLDYGVKLLSKRKLSDFLAISQNTVETAYEQLVAEGYVESIPRKGYFVMAYEDLDYLKATTITTDQVELEEEEFLYHFHPGWIDSEKFPFSKWRKYAKNMMDKEHHSLLLLGDNQGEYELRKEIASYLYHARGVKCSPEEIIIGAGSEILLHQLVLLFSKQPVYGVEDPGYHIISRILKHFPNKVHPLAVDDEGVKVNQLEKEKVDVVYVTPSHHFPYGSVLSVNRRIKLLNWSADKENRFIIEDDYDSEFRYNGKLIPSLQSMDQAEKVIYLGTFSKSLIPSIRISFMVVPKNLMKIYLEKLSFYHCSVSRLDQHILAQFMKEGDFERHLNRMRKIYRRKLERTLELLKPYRHIVEIMGKHSGLHIVLIIKNGLTEQQLVNRAKDVGIKVYPLSYYSLDHNPETPAKIVLGFAGIPEQKLEEAMNLLIKSWGLS